MVRNISRLIEESLSIAQNVVDISEYIGNVLFHDIQNTHYSKGKSSPGVSYKHNQFIINKFGLALTVNWEFFDASNKNYLRPNMINRAKAKIADNELDITIVSTGHKLDKRTIFEMVQHEIQHFFEHVKSGGNYGLSDNYKTAVKVLYRSLSNPKTVTPIEWRVAIAIYICHKFEQRGYANGAYQFLMKSSDYDNDFKNVIKETKLYKCLDTLFKIENRIRSGKEDNDVLEQVLSQYNLTQRKFLELITNTKKNILRLIGRIMVKAKNDYRESHNILEDFDMDSIFEFFD